MFDQKGVLFWPIGTGDSTSFVIREEEKVFQVDLRHTEQSEDTSNDAVPIIDRLEKYLPKKNGKPYLSSFALTHPDKDHIQGFESLLDRVVIGELWFTPRVFREHEEDLCPDAIAFRDEAHRRVSAAIEEAGDPGSGNRVRLIGYDALLQEDQYKGFPEDFFSIPGHTVTSLDGEDLCGEFSAFIHAPFKQDEIPGDRNDTSLAMQIVFGADEGQGGVLLFGDHKYPTIRKIYDLSKERDNENSLKWQVMLASHHCSKSVMYQKEEDKERLKQDILDDFEKTQVDNGYVVSSSDPIPGKNLSGENPPHARAKSRYEEIAQGGFLCTHEDCGEGQPIRFCVDGKALVYSNGKKQSKNSEKAGLAGAISEARGSDEAPSSKVGFGD